MYYSSNLTSYFMFSLTNHYTTSTDTASFKVKEQSPLIKIKPMLAERENHPFDHPDWIFEIKHGGCRAIATINATGVLIHNRNFISFNQAFPQLVQELSQIGESAVVDGEIVCRINKKGDQRKVTRKFYFSCQILFRSTDLICLKCR
jgi:ATP-dependent DNA ligase